MVAWRPPVKGDLLKRIYLDNAATSWPKPESVYTAIENIQREIGAPAGRGGYREASQVHQMIQQTRQKLAQFINAPLRQNVAFTYSGTDALCTAILGILNGADHVVTSMAEHNSVLRPLRYLESQNKIRLSIVPSDLDGLVDPKDIHDAICDDTKLVVLTHVSNVTGAIQSAAEIGAMCRSKETMFLLDAAQSIGHIPIDVRAIGCDMLAAPGHKGLLGPLGTGILYYTDQIASQLRPLRLGGTGTPNGTDRQPDQCPDKFEAGNLNVPGIAGIAAGLEFLQSDEGSKRQQATDHLVQQMLDGLVRLSESGLIQLHGPTDVAKRTGVFSIAIGDMQCTDAAAILDATWSIQTRAGLHCAPLMHESLGTQKQGGSVRLSLGLFNTQEDVAQALKAINEIAVSLQ